MHTLGYRAGMLSHLISKYRKPIMFPDRLVIVYQRQQNSLRAFRYWSSFRKWVCVDEMEWICTYMHLGRECASGWPIGAISGLNAEPRSVAPGVKELLIDGMALLTNLPQVAMLMFIWGARRNVLPKRNKVYVWDEETSKQKITLVPKPAALLWRQYFKALYICFPARFIQLRVCSHCRSVVLGSFGLY